jgi:nitroimidazol reductase NimA-like FMN-containing flavoprotein (pyridoxamine 5'-phosphate oxidase superfamily)
MSEDTQPSPEAQPAQAASKQRRGRRIALTEPEIDAFLSSARTCRVATVSHSGPHVSPLWFLWHGGALWLYSIVSSQRFTDLRADPRVAVVIDDGHDFTELRGVELTGEAEVVGEVPRTGDDDVPELVDVEAAYARKYQDREQLSYDERHAWVRITPAKLVSWDFRKMPLRS